MVRVLSWRETAEYRNRRRNVFGAVPSIITSSPNPSRIPLLNIVCTQIGVVKHSTVQQNTRNPTSNTGDRMDSSSLWAGIRTPPTTNVTSLQKQRATQ